MRPREQLGTCPACGLRVVVDAAGAPLTDHLGSRLCRELAAERAATPQRQLEEPRP